MEYTVVYANSLFLCLVATFILFLFHSKSWKSKFWNPLSCSYILIMLSLISDIIWIFLDGKKEYIPLNYILNCIEYSTFGLIGYGWYCYCAERFLSPVWRKKETKFYLFLPCAVVTALILLSPKYNLVFKVTEDGYYQRGPFFFLQQVGYLYLALCTVVSIICYKKTELYRKKQQFKIMALFAIPASILGGIQLLLPEGALPTLQFSIFLSLLIVYSNEQEQKITVDPLTKLINHYEFERVLLDEISKYKKTKEGYLFLLVGDLDKFKTINDNFGHLEGDRALRTVARTLDELSSKYSATIARMSGDEFLFLILSERENAPEEFSDDVLFALQRASYRLPYRLSMSIGYSKYDDSMSVSQLLDIADRNMYTVKKQKITV